MTIVGSMGATEHQYLVAGEDLVLAYELSRPDAAVRWLRDGHEVQPGERVQVEARGVLRQLTVRGMQPSDSGCYICDAASDRVAMNVEVSGELAGAQCPRDPPARCDRATALGGGRGCLCDPADGQGQGGSVAAEVGTRVPNPTGAVGWKGTCQGHGEICPSRLLKPGAG